MKRFISMIAALALVFALAPTVLADEWDDGIFTDVPADAWYAEDLDICWAYDLAAGTGGGKFSPDKTITLAEAVTFAARVRNTLSWPETDFEQGDPWYQTYVDYAVENGILEKDRFADLTVPATRRQFATLIAAAISAEMPEAINPVEDGAIPDLEAGSEGYDQVYSLYRAGVLTGSDGGKFKPETQISRAEVVAVIARCVDSSRLRSFMLTKEGYRDYCVGGIALDPPEGFEVTPAANGFTAYAYEDGEMAAGIMAQAAAAGVTPETVGNLKSSMKSLISGAMTGIFDFEVTLSGTEYTDTTVLGYDTLAVDTTIADDSYSMGRVHMDIVFNTDTGFVVMFTLAVLDSAKVDYDKVYEDLLAGATPDTTGSLKPNIRPEFIAAVDEVIAYMKDYLDLARRYEAATESQRQLLALELTGLAQRYADIEERYGDFTDDISDGEMTYMLLMILSLRDSIPEGDLGDDIWDSIL